MEGKIVTDEGTRDLQSDRGSVVSAPLITKSSQGGKSMAATTSEDQPAEDQSKAPNSTKPCTEDASGSRMLRSRQRGGAGTKGKSRPKKIKVEDSGEILSADSQETDSIHSVPEQSERNKEHNKEEPEEHRSEEGMTGEKSTDVSLDNNKRILRKRKQTDYGGGGNSSKRMAVGRKSTEGSSSEIPNSAKTPKSEPETSKPDLEPTPDTKEGGEQMDKTMDKSEQLIVRVSTSNMTKSKKEGVESEGDSLSGETSIKETDNQSKQASNEEDPPSSTVASSTSVSGQSSSSDQLSHDQSCDQSTSEDGQTSKANEGNTVEPPKTVDSSQLPPMIQIRAGMQVYNLHVQMYIISSEN